MQAETERLQQLNGQENPILAEPLSRANDMDGLAGALLNLSFTILSISIGLVVAITTLCIATIVLFFYILHLCCESRFTDLYNSPHHFSVGFLIDVFSTSILNLPFAIIAASVLTGLAVLVAAIIAPILIELIIFTQLWFALVNGFKFGAWDTMNQIYYVGKAFSLLSNLLYKDFRPHNQQNEAARARYQEQLRSILPKLQLYFDNIEGLFFHHGHILNQRLDLEVLFDATRLSHPYPIEITMTPRQFQSLAIDPQEDPTDPDLASYKKLLSSNELTNAKRDTSNCQIQNLKTKTESLIENYENIKRQLDVAATGELVTCPITLTRPSPANTLILYKQYEDTTTDGRSIWKPVANTCHLYDKDALQRWFFAEIERKEVTEPITRDPIMMKDQTSGELVDRSTPYVINSKAYNTRYRYHRYYINPPDLDAALDEHFKTTALSGLSVEEFRGLSVNINRLLRPIQVTEANYKQTLF